MSKHQVVYLMSGKPHLPYLIVSLDALRQRAGFTGNVRVYAYPESLELVQRIAEDALLGIEAHRWFPNPAGRNSQFINKIDVMRTQDADTVNLYLDADTLPVRLLDMLFPLAETCGFVATQFNDWKTNNGAIKTRLESLLEFPEVNKHAVTALTESPCPSVNGGIWACRPDSPILPRWKELTMACNRTFIPDEKVLHLMQVEFSPNEFCVATSGEWNCSPKFKPKNMLDMQVCIWHFHGDSCVRPEKSQKGYDLWWPEFLRCLDENRGGMAEWIDVCGNNWIEKLRKPNGT